MAAILPFLPLIAKLAFWFLEKFIGGNNQDEQSREIFLNLAKLLRRNGIKNVKSRFESEQQIDQGNAEWDKRENATTPDGR